MSEREEELVICSCKGDLEAFEQLISIYQRQVFTVAYRFMGNKEDASDLAQEALIKAYRSIQNFRRESSFKTWLYRITANVCCDELRKRRRRNEVSLDEPIVTQEGEIFRETEDCSMSPESVYETKEREQYIQQLINGLKPEYRAVIVLRDIMGFSYSEIAEELNCSLGTVKSRLSRARRTLRDKIADRKELLHQDTSLIK